ncbi:MAG: hypothetical protein E5Y55_24115 [Mesorhizobium sp.]|uniref:hypothetical protein n=1 Tax=Mesorhizobium sp. TaxID=1871066 RepID=UPI00120B8DA4|nr:hypothetical protein [Mesorhizobium sp.]TIM41767.1 MAG: hypothetical protein E5Y55_24115 [Mesorhizobium sp.]
MNDYSPAALRRATPRPLPAIEIVALGEFVEHSRILARWTVGDARFFVWLDKSGTEIAPNAFIHKNSVAPEWIGEGSTRRKNPDAFPHRAVSQTAAAHAPIVAAIRAAIADGSLARAACEKYKAEYDAAEVTRLAAYVARIRLAIEHAADRMQLEGKGQDAHDIRFVALLNPDLLINLAGILQDARNK